MSLVEKYPDGIADILRERGVNGDEFVIALESDIGPDGQFGKQWLLATQERLVVRQNKRPGGRQRSPGDLNRAAAESMVGAGVLRIVSKVSRRNYSHSNARPPPVRAQPRDHHRRQEAFHDEEGGAGLPLLLRPCP